MPIQLAQSLINNLQLEPHPEGGYFRQTYISQNTTLIPERGVTRSLMTSIYFLIPAGDKSRLHRIQSDEIWFFHCGDPLTIFEIDQHGETKETNLGYTEDKVYTLQHLVPTHSWFGCTPNSNQNGFSLVSCVVAPGFDFEDFELADQKHLLQTFPDLKNLILELT